jgi:hypothetical protein
MVAGFVLMKCSAPVIVQLPFVPLPQLRRCQKSWVDPDFGVMAPAASMAQASQ